MASELVIHLRSVSSTQRRRRNPQEKSQNPSVSITVTNTIASRLASFTLLPNRANREDETLGIKPRFRDTAAPWALSFARLRLPLLVYRELQTLEHRREAKLYLFTLLISLLSLSSFFSVCFLIFFFSGSEATRGLTKSSQKPAVTGYYSPTHRLFPVVTISGGPGSATSQSDRQVTILLSSLPYYYYYKSRKYLVTNTLSYLKLFS